MPTTTANVYQAEVTFTGTIGLVLDNIDTADPENPIAVEIKKITDKGSDMTEEDRKRKDWLAYQGSFYKDDAGKPRYAVALHQESTALRCLPRRGNLALGQDRRRDRAGSHSRRVPAVIQGAGGYHRNSTKTKHYCLRLMVNKNPSGKKAMIPSVRPILPRWSL